MDEIKDKFDKSNQNLFHTNFKFMSVIFYTGNL